MLGADECFHLVGSFIVQFVKLRFEPSLYKPVVRFAVCSEEFFLGPVLDGDRSNVVGIVYVEDDYVYVAPIRCFRESSCLVAGDGAADGVDVAEDEVGTGVVGFLGGVFHVFVVM